MTSEQAGSASRPTRVRWGTVVLDTADPSGLAAFYAELLGWAVVPETSADDWINVQGPEGQRLAFQLAPDHVAPTWPDPRVPQQVHLDLFVASYDEPEARALALGARLLEGSEDHDDFRVYADPSGHPFCFCIHPDEE